MAHEAVERYTQRLQLVVEGRIVEAFDQPVCGQRYCAHGQTYCVHMIKQCAWFVRMHPAIHVGVLHHI